MPYVVIKHNPTFKVNKLRNIQYGQLTPGTILGVSDTNNNVYYVMILISSEQINNNDCVSLPAPINPFFDDQNYLKITFVDGCSNKISVFTIRSNCTVKYWNFLAKPK